MHLNDIFDINVSRAKRWHPEGINSWTPLEWAGAMCGEAGEAANFAKKYKRITDNIVSINEAARYIVSIEEAKEAIAKEVADTILYGLLLLAAIEVINPEDIIRSVFNKKSEEYGFPERI